VHPEAAGLTKCDLDQRDWPEDWGLREIQHWVAVWETVTMIFECVVHRRGWVEDRGVEGIQCSQNWVAACETMGPRLVKTEETVQELEWHYRVNGKTQKVAGLMYNMILRVSMSCS
jgi:hypothetical protein